MTFYNSLKSTPLFLCLVAGATMACNSTVSTAGGGGQGGTGGQGGAEICRQASDCAPSEFCNFPDSRCGAGMTGVCMARSGGCSDGPFVCGCDGQTYSIGCNALYGVDSDTEAAHCQAPEGMFACGDSFCSSWQYCNEQHTAGPVDTLYECRSLPADCDEQASCDCLASEECGDWCNMKDDHATLTCGG